MWGIQGERVHHYGGFRGREAWLLVGSGAAPPLGRRGGGESDRGKGRGGVAPPLGGGEVARRPWGRRRYAVGMWVGDEGRDVEEWEVGFGVFYDLRNVRSPPI